MLRCKRDVWGWGGERRIRLALYIGLFVLAVCVCLALADVRLRGRHFRGRRLARFFMGASLLCAYAGGLYLLTLGGRTAGPARTAKLEPLWSYRESLVLFGGTPGVSNASLLAEIILNILLFVPLGALLAFAWPRRFRGLRGAALVAAVGAGCSTAIELSQLAFRLGLLEFDDVMNNTLGACAGYVAYSLLSAAFRHGRGRPVGS